MRKIVLSLACVGLMFAGTAMADVNVNTASAEQLSSLDGIGSVKAQAIIKDREANGEYQELAELTRVNGVGNKTIEGIRDEANVGQSPDAAAD